MENSNLPNANQPNPQQPGQTPVPQVASEPVQQPNQPFTYNNPAPAPGQINTLGYAGANNQSNAADPNQVPPANPVPGGNPDPSLRNKKSSKTGVIVGAIVGVVVLVLVVASVGIWAFLGSSKADDSASTKPNGGSAPAPAATNASEIKFNTDFDATTMDLKLTGKSVKWDNPCSGLYHLDPARPYVLCDDKQLFEIRPDGSSKKIDGKYDSNKIRYGYVILHDDKGYDDRIFNISKNIVSILPKAPNSRVYFYTSEYFVRTFTNSDSLTQVQVIDALGQTIDEVVAGDHFQPSEVGNADIKYENMGFFPVFPEKKNFIAFNDMVRNPPEQTKAKMDLSQWYITKDGTAVFTGRPETGFKVTTYNNNLEKVDECQYPKLPDHTLVTNGQNEFNSQNLLTNQAFIDECKFFQDLVKNPLKDGEYLMLLPNGKHQRWSIDSKTGEASFNGVSYKDITGQKIAVFFDHGNQILVRNGAVIQLGKSDPIYTTEQHPVPINYNCHKQFLLMDGRLWELAPAD